MELSADKTGGPDLYLFGSKGRGFTPVTQAKQITWRRFVSDSFWILAGSQIKFSRCSGLMNLVRMPLICVIDRANPNGGLSSIECNWLRLCRDFLPTHPPFRFDAFGGGNAANVASSYIYWHLCFEAPPCRSLTGSRTILPLSFYETYSVTSGFCPREHWPMSGVNSWLQKHWWVLAGANTHTRFTSY